jgi:hypothetical protein
MLEREAERNHPLPLLFKRFMILWAEGYNFAPVSAVLELLLYKKVIGS